MKPRQPRRKTRSQVKRANETYWGEARNGLPLKRPEIRPKRSGAQ